MQKTQQGFILTTGGWRTTRHLYKSLLRLTYIIQHEKECYRRIMCMLTVLNTDSNHVCTKPRVQVQTQTQAA